jgi:hypothetical protein
MSAPKQPADLAEIVRDRAKSRGEAVAFEFEGRLFRRIRHQDQSRRQCACSARRQAGRADRLSRQEQRHLFRIAAGCNEGRHRDGAGELAARRARGRLHRRRLQGAGAVRRSRIHRASAQHQGKTAERSPYHHRRRRRTGMAGLFGLARRAKRRRSKAADQPEGHRDPALYLGHDGQAERRDAVACQLSQSGAGWQRGRKAGMEPLDDRRRLAGGDADLPYRRLRLGRDGSLSRRQGGDRARVRSDQGFGFLRAPASQNCSWCRRRCSSWSASPARVRSIFRG